MNRRLTPMEIAGSLAVLAALLALWWLASHAGWVSKVFLPTPEATLASLHEGLAAGELADFTAATVGRMLAGWALAGVAGIGLGALVGSSAAARAWVGPTLEFIRPLPASAVMPLAIAIFGLSGGMVLGWWPSAPCGRCCWARCMGWSACTRACAKWLRHCNWGAASLSGRSACPTPCPTSWPACGWP